MKTIMHLGIAGVFVCLLGGLLVEQCALRRATAAAAQGDATKAYGIASGLHGRPPVFLAERTRVLCGQFGLDLARARMAPSEPQYVEALRALEEMLATCSPTPLDSSARILIGDIARRHFTDAAQLCRSGNPAEGVRLLESALNAGYPEETVSRAAAEAVWCRVTGTELLAREGRTTEALAYLAPALTAGGDVQFAAIRQARTLLAPAIHNRIDEARYADAVRLLEEARTGLGQEPGLESVFARLEQDMARSIFGIDLGARCSGRAAPATALTAGRLGPASAESAAGGPNVTVFNTTTHDLQLALRGPVERRDRVPSGGRRLLSLDPGEYVVLAIPADCTRRSLWSTWTIGPNASHLYMLSEP